MQDKIKNIYENRLMPFPYSLPHKNAVEEILHDYLKHAGYHENNLSWGSLAGTGETSQRHMVTVETEGKNVLRFVVKRYTISGEYGGRAELQAWREYQALRHISALGQGRWYAPHPIAFVSKHATVIMEYCCGINVNSIFWNAVKHSFLSRKNKELCLSLTIDIANILKEMQTMSYPGNWLNTSDLQWYMSFLDEQLDAIKLLGFPQCDSIRSIMEEKLSLMLSEENRCFQHTDFYFNNVLRLNGTYYVLDFPNAVWGTRYWDISHMLISLDDFKLYRNANEQIIDACRQEFQNAFAMDQDLIRFMQILHYCFSYKLSLMASKSGIRGFLCREPRVFYQKRIDALMNGL